MEKRSELSRCTIVCSQREPNSWASMILNDEVEYYGAAEPPVRCGESHLSGLTEPPIDSYSA